MTGVVLEEEKALAVSMGTLHDTQYFGYNYTYNPNFVNMEYNKMMMLIKPLGENRTML